MMESDLDLDGSSEDGYMSGTFRWKKTKKLLSMPKRSAPAPAPLVITKGWMDYLMSRGTSDQETYELISQAKSDLSLIDCLSTPLSIASLCQKAGIYDAKRPLEALHIVCVGTSSKAEGRVLNETNCFTELSYIFSSIADIHLHLVGPEMDTTSLRPRQLAGNLRVSEYRGTSKDFFRQAPLLLLGSSTVVIGINCGFGNWENPLPVRFNLLMQWLPDLYFLTGTRLPLLFTCANDYADLSGEVAVMQHVMGSSFLVTPGRNSLSYASTLVPPGETAGADDYSCGNSFIYGVQGHDKSRRQVIKVGDVTALMRALQAPLLPIPTISRSLLPFGTPPPPLLSSSSPSSPLAPNVVIFDEPENKLETTKKPKAKTKSKAKAKSKINTDPVSDPDATPCILTTEKEDDDRELTALLAEKAAADFLKAAREATLAAALKAEQAATEKLLSVQAEATAAKLRAEQTATMVQNDGDVDGEVKRDIVTDDDAIIGKRVTVSGATAKIQEIDQQQQQHEVKVETVTASLTHLGAKDITTKPISTSSLVPSPPSLLSSSTVSVPSPPDEEMMRMVQIFSFCTVTQSTITPPPPLQHDPTTTITTTTSTLNPLQLPLLLIRVQFHVAVASLSDLSVDVHGQDKSLCLGVNLQGRDEQHVCISLLTHINTATMTAKYSKKQKQLTLKAAIATV
jgi:hypothetical protein